MAKRKAAKRAAGKAPASAKTSAKSRRSASRAGGKSARKAPKTATRKSAGRTATRKTAKRAARPAKKASRSTARKSAAGRKAAKQAAPKKKAALKKASPRRAAAKAPARKAARKAPKALVARRAPALDRARRTVVDEDIVQTPPSSLDLDRSASAFRTGRREMKQRYDLHTETSPAITAGDVDADWESAYSVGDEAPGGDNPTPDQDIVDDIGRAVGVQYDDNEELKGEKKISDRDAHRWELDPASAEDYNEHEED